jgi:serine/threonine protein phosphatase PrpC
LCVDEVVSPIAQHPADNERSLPGRGQLVHAFGVLDQPEYEISFAKCERMDFLAVVSSQLLLIER